MKKLSEKIAKGSPKACLDVLFEDYYKNRFKLYWMNFWRGIFFGFGSAIGATLLIWILLWFLSQLQTLPYIGEFSQKVHDGVQSTQD
ncbi:MAG: DUF5665 domain-containing protein [Candidatus Woesebacteria bacterium]|jgi:hypothetical protein